MRNNQDTPLIARSIRRVRKGVYELKLHHPSGRLFGYERVNAANKEAAVIACRRLYPSTVALPKRQSCRTKASKPKPLTGMLTKELRELQIAIALVDNSGES